MVMLWRKRLSAIGLALLLSVPSGCAFLTGGARLALWSTARQPHQYAVDYPYLSDATPWIAMGLIGIIGSFAVLTSRRRTLWWLWLPVVTLVYCTLLPLQTQHGFFFHRATHPMVGLPIHWAQAMTRHDLNQITGTIAQQAISNGRFECPTASLSDRSRFTQGGASLAYTIQCTNLQNPNMPIVPLRPATIFMTVSPDEKEAWFRVSGLVSDTGGVTEWIKNYGGYDYIVHHSVRTDKKIL
jgi:hypothetical protein